MVPGGNARHVRAKHDAKPQPLGPGAVAAAWAGSLEAARAGSPIAGPAVSLETSHRAPPPIGSHRSYSWAASLAQPSTLVATWRENLVQQDRMHGLPWVMKAVLGHVVIAPVTAVVFGVDPTVVSPGAI